MSFTRSVKLGFQNYANFKGRATRPEYWWWVLFTLILTAAVSVFENADEVVSVALFLPSLSVAVRRMHDSDHGGWWVIAPIVNFVFALTKSDELENRFGPPRPPSNLLDR